MNQRLYLAVFYFTDDALSWYKYLSNNRLLGTWPEFSRALELRFGPSSYENHQATLFKLQQKTTVAMYQTEFERLANRVIGLSPETLKNCFISGLKPDIQSELAIHHPHTLHQTYGLARLIEDKLAAGVIDSTVGSVSSPQSASSLPIKRLTQAEMQAKRAAGLCFNCDEKFQPGHRCKTPQFLLFELQTDPPWTGTISTNVVREDTTRFKGVGIDTDPP
ncbi:putative retrotransposon gag domain-containing protein [Helianthus annuus]|nr:putative retrotransposon gag domain-containing protein [Helianthus annuus]